MAAGLGVSVYDKDLQFVGWVSNPIYMSFSERWHGLGSGEIEVAATDPALDCLLAPGARVKVEYNPDGMVEPGGVYTQVLSGPVRGRGGSFLPTGTVRVQVQDDWRHLRNMQAYVVPTGNVKADSLTDRAQSNGDGSGGDVAGKTVARTGRYAWPASPTVYPAETAVLRLLLENLQIRYHAKRGDWDPANGNIYKFGFYADGGRGGDVRSILPQIRFGSLEAAVLGLLDAQGLGLRFEVVGESSTAKGRVFARFWTPQVWDTTLTPDSGAVLDGKWSETPPAATDVIVGGPGEETARAFRLVSDPVLAAEWEDVIEVFREATGAPVYWPPSMTDDSYKVEMYYHLIAAIDADRKAAFESFLLNAGAKELAEGAPTSGIDVELQETEAFRYVGDHSWRFNAPGFNTGDIVTVAPSADAALAGKTFTDRITQTDFTVTAKGGVTVKPTLGSKKDDPNLQLALAVAALAADARQRNTNQ